MTKGKLLVGFGGLSGMVPCVYKDTGPFEKAVDSAMRRVQMVELLKHVRLAEVPTSERKVAGYRNGGGITTLYLATEAQLAALRALNSQRQAGKERKAVEAKAQAKAETEAQFAKARETGQRVLLRQYHTDCDGSATECSLDVVSVWAMPDGTTAQTRIHAH